MNDAARESLFGLVAKYGRGVADDAKRCEGLIRDFCPQHRREANVLISALNERVPAELLASSGSLPKTALMARLTNRLHDSLGLDEGFARWAVESWALALGTISGIQPIPPVSRSAAPLPSPAPESAAPKVAKPVPSVAVVDPALPESESLRITSHQASLVEPGSVRSTMRHQRGSDGNTDPPEMPQQESEALRITPHQASLIEPGSVRSTMRHQCGSDGNTAPRKMPQQ